MADEVSGIERKIRQIEAGERIEDIVASTSERCALALIYDRPDLLPKPYTSTILAWRRLDTGQRGIVRKRAPDVADFLGCQ